MKTKRLRNFHSVAFAFALAVCAAPAFADLQDEIQVYDDSINAPGELGLELHLNTTPHGRNVPAYPGEVTPDHGWRTTPEFSLGLTSSLEAGLYLPLSSDDHGGLGFAGPKLRIKWLPVKPSEDGGAFAGVNFELAQLKRVYALPQENLESRFIAGWRSPQWLFAVNPIFDFGLSDGANRRRPDFNLGVKAARSVSPGVMAGLEYYTYPTASGARIPWQQQDNRLYVALDVDRAPWVFNIAVGRALTPTADRWTIKAIFEVPLPKS